MAAKYFRFRQTDNINSILESIWKLRPEMKGKKALTAQLALGALLRECTSLHKAYSSVTLCSEAPSTSKPAKADKPLIANEVNTDDEWG